MDGSSVNVSLTSGTDHKILCTLQSECKVSEEFAQEGFGSVLVEEAIFPIVGSQFAGCLQNYTCSGQRIFAHIAVELKETLGPSKIEEMNEVQTSAPW